MSKNPHHWKFHRVGGLDQVSLTSADDLRHLGDLDQKLWTALACPTRGLELDSKTLQLLDLDGDGRVRVPEVVAAIKWCDARLRDLADLVPGRAEFPLSAIDTTRPEGQALLGAARRVLGALQKPDAEVLTPADVANLGNVFEGTAFNGDGVVPPEAAGDDAETRQVMADAMACAGSEPDRSGHPGISRKRLEAFFADLAAYEAWWREGDVPEVQTLGAGTGAAHAAVSAVRAKVTDFFTRCRLAVIDPRGAALLNRSEAELVALAAQDLSTAGSALRDLPLARVEAGRALPLEGSVNPAWSDAVAALARDAVTPILGARPALDLAGWEAVLARLAPYAAWQAAKKGAAVEPLGIARVRALLQGGGRAAVEVLLARDEALAPEATAVGDVARMVHYFRDLHTLLRNFVAFSDFYDPGRDAIFQAGKLYLDARSCDLCIRVDDAVAHAALAGLSRMYLAYCDCRRPGGETLKIAACFTQGDSDYLRVGRNGVFYDRQGRDWDATIVKIVENPISIRQAFFAPYKKFVTMIEDQVARFAAAKEKEADARLAAAATGTVDHATAAKAAAKAEAMDVGKMVGIIAALGVGAGAIGTLFGGLISGFIGLQPWWAKLVAVAGVLLAISGPSVLVAWLKLRQRTLGPVLDATGWAVNGRVKVNIPLGTSLTHRAALPPGSARSLEDPYEDKAARRQRRLFWTVVVVVALALAAARYLHTWPFRPL